MIRLQSLKLVKDCDLPKSNYGVVSINHSLGAHTDKVSVVRDLGCSSSY